MRSKPRARTLLHLHAGGARLARLAMGFGLAIAFASVAMAATTTKITGFGSNPGMLRMFEYVPDSIRTSPALVVALHGMHAERGRIRQGTRMDGTCRQVGLRPGAARDRHLQPPRALLQLVQREQLHRLALAGIRPGSGQQGQALFDPADDRESGGRPQCR